MLSIQYVSAAMKARTIYSTTQSVCISTKTTRLAFQTLRYLRYL